MKKLVYLFTVLSIFSCATSKNYTDSALKYDEIIKKSDFMYIFIPENYKPENISYYKTGEKDSEKILKNTALLNRYYKNFINDKNLPFTKNEILTETDYILDTIDKFDIIKKFSGNKTKKIHKAIEELAKAKDIISNIRKELLE